MIVRCHTSILMALECTYKKNVSRKVSEREKWNVRSQKESFLKNWQLDGEGEKEKSSNFNAFTRPFTSYWNKINFIDT